MHSRTQSILGAIALFIAGGAAAYWLRPAASQPTATPLPVNASAKPIDPAATQSNITPTPETLTAVRTVIPPIAVKSAPPLSEEAIVQEIQKVDEATTFDAIKPHLYSSSPEVREAAKQALIRMGDSKASPLLRDAADQPGLPPNEALELLDAADFLDLPDSTYKFGRKQKAPVPAVSSPLPQAQP